MTVLLLGAGKGVPGAGTPSPVVYSDDFSSYAAGSDLDAAANWVQHSSASVPTTVTAQGRIRMGGTPNQVGTGMCYVPIAPATAEYDVASDFYVASLTSTIRGGIAGRVDTAANTMYVARYEVSVTQWQLLKLVAGVSTTLGSFVQTLTAGNTYAVTLQIRNATKKVFIGGVERISSTDNAITAAGFAGERVSDNGGADTTGLQLDNFVVTNA